MTNELLFLVHAILVTGFAILASFLGRSALVCSVVLQGVLSNLFVGKQMGFLGLSVTCADAYIVGAILSLSLLQEKYGDGAGRTATLSYLLFAVWYVVMTTVHCAYEPLACDGMHQHFAAVFSYAPRVIVASVLAMFFGMSTNRVALARLDLGWLFNVIVAFVASQVVDTVVFSFVGLYGFVASVVDVMVVALSVKILAMLCAVLCIWLVRRLVGVVDGEA